jgi:hypothetical protein
MIVPIVVIKFIFFIVFLVPVIGRDAMVVFGEQATAVNSKYRVKGYINNN